MGHGRHVSSGSDPIPAPTPPAPVADYNVTGDPNPDCKCNYWLTGTHNGKSYYRRTDGSYFIWWWQLVGVWVISTILGVYGPFVWGRMDPNIEGLYLPEPGVSGNPFVSAGPH